VKKGIAIFDLDGTLTDKDTFIEFIRYSYGTFKLFIGFLINVHFVLLYWLKLYPNDLLKQRIFSHFFKDRSVDEIGVLGDAFSENVLPALCASQSLDVLLWHRSKGHEIVIITASSALWLAKWCEKNKFLLICTHYQIVNGFFTGKIDGKNCYGAEKLIRLAKEVDLSHYAVSYGYGNSKEDLFFLQKLQNYQLGTAATFTPPHS
jgi:phosphatidylglycerophosphatase C